MRRRLLARVSLLVLMLLALFPFGSSPAVATSRVTGEIVANDVVFDTPARGRGLLERDAATPAGANTGSMGATVLRYTSPPVAAGQSFDRAGMRWTTKPGLGETLFVELRASTDGIRWGGWQPMLHAHDLDDEPASTYYAPPQPVSPDARYVQYRLWLADGDLDAVSRIGVTFLDVNDLNLGPVARLLNDVRGAFADLTNARPAAAAPVDPSRILTRRDWGADENLMRWTPRYPRQQTKAIVHHTVTSDGGSNVAAEIRSIYYFHAVTRGWGDIGYNYLVDKFGNIWTGRQGGDHVEAGHAFGWNQGAIGVASIGDYSVSPPTSALQGAIANIIGMKFAQYGIAPLGADSFVHQERRADGTWVDVTSSPPNIIGHRDANYVVGGSGGQTACPGNTIAEMMDGLRRLAQGAVAAGYTNLIRFDPALPRATFPGASLQVAVTVTNRGATTVPAGTVVSYQILSPSGAAVVAQGGKGTIAAGLAPGASATVQVPLTAPAAGSYVVRWDLQSGTSWWNQLRGTPVRDQWLRSTDWSADWLSDNVPGSFTAGETRTVSATILNDGGRTWPAGGTNPVKVAYSWRSVATGNVMQGANTQALPSDVAPGQRVTVAIPITAPAYPTNYSLRLDLVKQNEFSFGDRGIAPDDTSIAVLIDARAAYQVGVVPPLAAGQPVVVPVTVTNTGRGIFPTTSSYPVALAYHWYDAAGRLVVYDGARTPLPADLPPGQSVALSAQVGVPASGGTYSLRFDLLQEGVAWFSARGVPTADRSVTVTGPVASVAPDARTYAATYRAQPLALPAGAEATTAVTLTNNGSFAWPAAGPTPVRLSYHWATAGGATVVWDGLRSSLPRDVAPGESVTVSAPVRAPAAAGSYLLRWDLVEEGVSWFSGKGVPTLDQNVQLGAAGGPAPGGFTYGSSMLPSTPAAMPQRTTTAVPVKVQNLGTSTWDGTVNLSYHWIGPSGGAVVWDGLRTPLAGISPGEVRDISAQVASPGAGTYTLRWDIAREGVAWFSGQGVQMPESTVRVEVPTYGALYAPSSASLSAAPGTVITVPVGLTNSGSATWQPNATNLSYHVVSASGGTTVWDGARTPLAALVAPNASVTLAAAVRAPATAGTYTLRFDMVQEGVTWFSGRGVPTGDVTLVVR